MSLLINPQQTYFDNNGNPLSNGWIYTYVPNSSTPKAAYLDEAETTPAANPVHISSSGRVQLFGTGSYRFVVQDSNHVQIYDSDTSSYLDSDTISTAMLPVVQSPTVAIARTRLGVDTAIADAILTVNLITGPASTVPGPQGPTGPTGPGAGTVTSNVQQFSSSGTWTKPASIQQVLIEIWGAGGAGTDAGQGGGGGGGGYSAILCLAAELASTVSVTVGTGGVFVSLNAGPGANGGDTNFGGYITHRGGSGGSVDGTGFIPVTGASGYLSAIAAITPLQVTYDYGYTISNDGFGNRYGAYPAAPSAGGDMNNPNPWATVLGGTGGTYPANGGGYPGGGAATNGGNGGNARVVVTSF